jgi:ATPase family associated with various cellular activities (AAA)
MIEEALALRPVAATRFFGERIAAAHPGKGVVEGPAYQFDPFAYAAAGACTIEPLPGEFVQLQTSWDGRHGRDQPAHGVFAVAWTGKTLTLYWFTPSENSAPYFALVADVRSDAMAFYETTCRWGDEPDGAILVFHAGQFLKDEQLFASIRDATFDNLVMPQAQKDEIATDAERFFASRDRYSRYAVPWKRGVLFAGPPGNGKTHAVKAIVNRATVRCVYVRSFDLPGHPFPGAGIAMVFDRARRIAPCIVVLEDLDSLVREDNRAYFLNELDGFEQNEGILVLATTNHPERIDASIIDRPSRFDRKYAFGLPPTEQRRAYVEQWNAGLDPELRLPDDVMTAIADDTDGFSFAYLKELFVSSLMRWVGDESVAFGTHVLGQIDSLREQMATEPGEAEITAIPGAESFGWAVPSRAMQHNMIRTMMRFGR